MNGGSCRLTNDETGETWASRASVFERIGRKNLVVSVGSAFGRIDGDGGSM